MANPWDDAAKALVDTIKERSQGFLDSHEDAKKFVEDRAARLAKLGYKYVASYDRLIKEQMEIVEQSIKNELASVAVDAAVEARSLFISVVETVFRTFVKILPSIISAI